MSASASGNRRGFWRVNWHHIAFRRAPSAASARSRRPALQEASSKRIRSSDSIRLTLTCSGCEAQGRSLPAAARTTESSARGAGMVCPRMRPDTPDILARRWAALLLALSSFLPVSHAGGHPARGRGVRHATGRRDVGATAVCRSASVCARGGAPIPRPLACAREGTCGRNVRAACARSGARDGALRL